MVWMSGTVCNKLKQIDMTPIETLLEWLAKNHYYIGNDLLEKVEQAKQMEKQQKHISIDKQVSILKDTLEEMMTGFESEEDRMDFILDICNGYRKRNI